MIAEIISVGTELLLGDIVNTNASYLSQQCANLGLSVYYQTVVGDNANRLKETIRQAMDRADVIFLGGGLGPTEDDLTKETVAEICGRTLYEDGNTRKHIEEFFANRGRKPTDNNWKQALVPEGAIILENNNGTAPGLIVEENGKILILLPGPPNEMIPLFKGKVYPYLRSKGTNVILSRMLKVCNVGESKAETVVKDLIHKYTNPTIATYAKPGEVHIRITASAATEEEAQKLLEPAVKEVAERFGRNVFATSEDEELEDVVFRLLNERGLTITTVESCTGGLLAARLVNVAGVSEVFKQGYVTYSNKAKRKMVLVKKSTLKEEGAVSEKTAKEMAKGAYEESGADVAVSITGLAGPEGATDDTPVGLVYMACRVNGKTIVQKCRFNGNRNKIREAAVTTALVLVRDCLLDELD